MDAKNISVGNRFALTSMAKLSANVIVAVVVASFFPSISVFIELISARKIFLPCL